jgi:hypothetical protein
MGTTMGTTLDLVEDAVDLVSIKATFGRCLCAGEAKAVAAELGRH